MLDVFSQEPKVKYLYPGPNLDLPTIQNYALPRLKFF